MLRFGQQRIHLKKFKINSRIKEISQAIIHIEDDSKNVLSKTTTLSKIAMDLNAQTQQSSAETEEQYAIMEGVKNDLINLRRMMEKLEESVFQFKLNKI